MELILQSSNGEKERTKKKFENEWIEGTICM